MTWGQELVKLRRMLRDPDAAIWSDAFLKHIYNDCQQDFQNKTDVLEDAVTQRVPSVYQFVYIFDWEYRYLPTDISQFYQALSLHDDGVCCHRWEPQQVAGLAADVADYGSHCTQPWESYMDESPGDLLKMRWPQNFQHVEFIAYNEQPIGATTRKYVQSLDHSYVNTEGWPIAYYPHDEVENAYVLYPRPSVSFDQELSGEGMALFSDDDTEDTTSGTIAARSGSYDDGAGMSVDIVDVTNSVFLVYAVSPTDVQSQQDESDFPEFLRKYIRYAVIARAYGGNNDGRIRSLSDFWFQRYQLGVQFVKRYRRNRRHDRDYRLTTKGATPKRTVKHPRLPGEYPAVDP